MYHLLPKSSTITWIHRKKIRHSCKIIFSTSAKSAGMPLIQALSFLHNHSKSLFVTNYFIFLILFFLTFLTNSYASKLSFSSLRWSNNLSTFRRVTVYARPAYKKLCTYSGDSRGTKKNRIFPIFFWQLRRLYKLLMVQ